MRNKAKMHSLSNGVLDQFRAEANDQLAEKPVALMADLPTYRSFSIVDLIKTLLHPIDLKQFRTGLITWDFGRNTVMRNNTLYLRI